VGYALSPEQFIDYLIERRGLVDFVELQLQGKSPKTWAVEDWKEIASQIRFLSEQMWTPSAEYVINLYQMQKERHEFWENSQAAQREKWEARAETWKVRALSAESRVAALEKAVTKKNPTRKVA
jgi:hypothetical protein